MALPNMHAATKGSGSNKVVWSSTLQGLHRRSFRKVMKVSNDKAGFTQTRLHLLFARHHWRNRVDLKTLPEVERFQNDAVLSACTKTRNDETKLPKQRSRRFFQLFYAFAYYFTCFGRFACFGGFISSFRVLVHAFLSVV